MLNLNEKYKPNSVNECLIDKEIKNVINNYIKNNTINNMLIVSSVNYCKTTLINCIINDYYKKFKVNNYKDYYKIINSTIEIKNIEEDINIFSKIIIKDYDTKIKKIIFFDNFSLFNDNIQSKIYNCMNLYKNIVFIFLTSKLIDVIDNIQNNIFIINISKIDEKEYNNYIKSICNNENINITDDALKNLYILSEGDIRFTLNQLNVLILLSKENKNILDINIINKIYNIPDNIIIDNIIKLCKEKNINELLKLSYKLINEDNFTCNDILNAVFIKLNYLDCETDEDIDLLDKIGKHRLYYSSSINSILQLEKCFINICK